jgi:SulP family sulfate permease
MIESLLCGASASRMKNSEFNADRELIAQGIGNIILPFFGGVPATAAIARTSVAIKSGCETRLTSIFHATVLLLSMFLLGPVMSQLPLSALAGVLIVTAFRMNEWNAIKYFFKRRFKGAILQFSVTLAATVVFDLTIAIMIGVVVCVFTFLLSSVDIHVSRSYIDNERLKKRLPDADADKTHPRTMIFYITGALFFANTDTLLKEIDGISDVNEIIFSFRGVTNLDSTAAHVLISRLKVLEKSGVTVRFSGVIEKVKTVLIRAGIYDVLDDSRFYSSVDKAILINTGLYADVLFNTAVTEAE